MRRQSLCDIHLVCVHVYGCERMCAHVHMGVCVGVDVWLHPGLVILNSVCLVAQ